MKKHILSIFCTLAVFTLGYSRAFSQAVATASSTATIISAVGVDNATNMVFGNITVSSSSTSAVLSASPASVVTVNGGSSVSAASSVSTSTAAAVNVSGSASYSYSASVSPSTISISDGKGNSVSVAPQLSSNVGTLDKDGKGVVYMGGTLTVNGSGSDKENGSIQLTFNFN